MRTAVPYPYAAQLGAALRARRSELGHTLQRVSESAGVSLGYLSQIELGRPDSVPTLGTLHKIAAALGRTAAWFLEEAERVAGRFDEIRKGGAN